MTSDQRKRGIQTQAIHAGEGPDPTTGASAPNLVMSSTFVVDEEASMSRRGNCHDNAVAESFFANLKKEKIRRVKYKTRADARHAMFEYIEMFYNPRRRHTHNSKVAPTIYEQRYFENQESV
jgi:transposase InsO family protein